LRFPVKSPFAPDVHATRSEMRKIDA
jgi:hypothetical protein